MKQIAERLEAEKYQGEDDQYSLGVNDMVDVAVKIVGGTYE